MNTADHVWNLESFLDAFIVELDQAQDTLAVKSVNRKLTYTVKDVALDMNIFPQYHQGKVMFAHAKPGESGASRLSLQLGSISDRQIQETTKGPTSKDDVSIDVIEELDEDTKDSLKKVGVRSVNDLERMEDRNIDVEKVINEKAPGAKKRNFGDLASMINRARRRSKAPKVSGLSLTQSQTGLRLDVKGEGLVDRQVDGTFPVAVWNGRKADVLSATIDRLTLGLEAVHEIKPTNYLQIALDPYAVITLEVQS